MDVADFDGTDNNFGDDEGDDDLEAELLALTSDGGHKKPAAKSMFVLASVMSHIFDPNLSLLFIVHLFV